MIDTQRIRRADTDPSSYLSVIEEFSQPIEQEALLVDDFLLYREGRLAIYYAPFDHINPDAEVVLLGVTPGWTQMQLSFATVRAAVIKGATHSQALEEVKRVAAFGGTMRRNLTAMLDGIGLPHALGLRHSDELFADGSSRLHGTSAIRYPVFVDGRNYSGHRPRLLDEPVLQWCVEHILAPELERVGRAMVVPLGRAAESAARRLVELHRLASERVTFGFPHPSGANPRRQSEYEANRNSMTESVRLWFGKK